MFRFTQRFGRDSQARWCGTGRITRGRRRTHRLDCEALEGRQLLSGYYIVNAASGNVLDDPNSSTSNGTTIDQYQLNGGANQQWNLVSQPNGYYEVVNASSGKVLDDPNSSTANGTSIDQWQANGGLNQRWYFDPLANGKFLIENASSSKVLDNPNSSTSNGTPVVQYEWNGGLNQQWVLLEAGNTPAVTEYVANASSGEVLDDPNSSNSNGTTIDQWPLNSGANQKWTFVQMGDGSYEIVNASSGKVLEDPAGSTSNGTPMDQWQLDGGLNQLWRIYRLSNGNHAILNASSGEALDDPNFATSNGTPVIQYQWKGGLNQQWVLFVPNTTATTSPNWSGYVAATNVSDPQHDSVTYVAGTWTVPTVTATSGNTASFAWVGIDGYGNGTVEQTGTAQGTRNGVSYYYAWWEMWSSINHQPEQTIATMTVSPGDSITASVTYEASGAHAGDFLLSINDTSHSNDSFNIYANPSQYQDPLPDRSTAEWIMETPSSGGTYATLPDFGTITFTNCSATINGTTGPINASSWQSRAVNLSRNGVTYDTTSALTQAGTSFAVIYNSAAAGQSGTDAKGMTPIGPTVGASLQSGKKTASPVIGRPAGTGAPGLPRFRRPIVQRERFARGFLIDPTARDAIFAEWDSSDS